MACFIQYGNYAHQPGEVELSIIRTPMESAGGIIRGWKERWDMSGRISAATPAALTLAIHALEAAYNTPGLDLGLYYSAGVPTAHTLLRSNTLGGARVVEPIQFPSGRGAELATYRQYKVSMEAEVANYEAGLIAFVETLSFSGGGPRYRHMELLTGPPQKQVLNEQTVYRCVQTGQAVGNLSYPFFPSPLFPGALMPDQSETAGDSPKRVGPLGSPAWVEWPIRWKYVFESASPLSGVPNRMMV